MPRPSTIWPRSGSEYYYTTIDGKQVRLAKTMTESKTMLQKLLKGQRGGPAEPGTTFRELAEKFLSHSQKTNEPETYECHRYFLQGFKDHVGNKRLVSRLCKADLDGWCQKMAGGGRKVNAGGRKKKDAPQRQRDAHVWSENTQARGRAVVLACLNYGVTDLNMPRHPLSHVRPGTVDRRELALTADQRQAIREAVSGPFADYLTALELTGARPFSEVCKVTAADCDLVKGTWVLRKWKNSKKKKGKPDAKRTIYLVPAMLEITRRLVDLHPEGPVFRNARGKPYRRQTITARFRRLGEKLGIDGLTAYALRHCYISDALLRGVPAAVVAELCGTSIQTIERHYRHLDVKHDALAEAARRAVGG